jgi:transposase
LGCSEFSGGTELGHEVLVAHAQKVQLITKSNRKDDRHDARTLARLARIDPELLGPVRHRSAKAQIHLTVIRARAELVSARTALVNAAREHKFLPGLLANEEMAQRSNPALFNP